MLACCCVRLHADSLPLMNNYLQRCKTEMRSSWCAAGRCFNTTHPGAFFAQTSFVFAKAVYGLIVVQLFISAQWDACRVSAGERFSKFAVLVEQHMRSCQFQGYPEKLVLDWSGTTHQVFACNSFCGYRDITCIYTSVNTVYSHNLHLEKL